MSAAALLWLHVVSIACASLKPLVCVWGSGFLGLGCCNEWDFSAGSIIGALRAHVQSRIQSPILLNDGIYPTMLLGRPYMVFDPMTKVLAA